MRERDYRIIIHAAQHGDTKTKQQNPEYHVGQAVSNASHESVVRTYIHLRTSMRDEEAQKKRRY